VILDKRNPINSMPFFPAEQDWTLATAARPSRVPLDKRFPVTYVVNSLPSLGGRKTQRRKGPGPWGKLSQMGPNSIPITANNRYGTRSTGEAEKDNTATPEWA